MARSPHHPAFANHQLAPTLDQGGVAVIHVGYGCDVPGCCSSPALVPWSYTVGLTALGRPELVILGLGFDETHDLVTSIMEIGDIATEQAFERNGRLVKLVDVPDDWVLTDPDRTARWFHFRLGAEHWPALPELRQIVWAGADGRFPDDPRGLPECAPVQPLLRDDPFSLPLVAARPKRRAGRHHRAA